MPALYPVAFHRATSKRPENGNTRRDAGTDINPIATGKRRDGNTPFRRLNASRPETQEATVQWEKSRSGKRRSGPPRVRPDRATGTNRMAHSCQSIRQWSCPQVADPATDYQIAGKHAHRTPCPGSPGFQPSSVQPSCVIDQPKPGNNSFADNLRGLIRSTSANNSPGEQGR